MSSPRIGRSVLKWLRGGEPCAVDAQQGEEVGGGRDLLEG